MDELVEQIKGQMSGLDSVDGDGYSDSVMEYFSYYGLDTAGAGTEHIFGTFESGPQRLAAHIFKPDGYKATVFALHGYLNHCGELRHLVRYLTSRGLFGVLYIQA